MVRAAVLRAQGGPVTVEDITLDPVGPGRVRVRIVAAGVCHSDLSLAEGKLRQATPCVLGHEGAGIVEEVGEGVGRVAVGDHVVLCWAPPDRTCRACRRGEPWLCEHAGDRAGERYATAADGEALYPSLSTGAFAEETVVDEAACVPIADTVALETAALVGCAVATGVGAVQNTAGVRPGERVLVLGLGGVGLSAVQGARLAGAATIVAADLREEKLALARDLGATDTLVSSPELPATVRQLTDGEGVDHAFEAVGTATTIRLAWKATRRGGRCTVIGIGGRDDEVAFGAVELFHFNRTLSSSVYGSVDPDVDFPRLLDWAREGRLDLDALVTERIGLDDVGAALDALSRGDGARRLVLPA